MDDLPFGNRKRKAFDDSDEAYLTPKKARIRYALSQVPWRNMANISIEVMQCRVQFEQVPSHLQPQSEVM